MDDDTDDKLEELETRLGVGFPPGRSDDAKPLRLGVDPVEVSHRSLVYYSLIVMIDPVALLCHLPDVAYGFLGRAPTTEILGSEDVNYHEQTAQRVAAGARTLLRSSTLLTCTESCYRDKVVSATLGSVKKQETTCAASWSAAQRLVGQSLKARRHKTVRGCRVAP